MASVTMPEILRRSAGNGMIGTPLALGLAAYVGFEVAIRARGTATAQAGSGGFRATQGRAASSWAPRRKSVASSP